MKNIALVGYTGFVGSNICAAAGDAISQVYNSRNIEAAYGTRPELLIYAGLRAEKYLANHDPRKDLALIRQAEENIEKIDPQNLVLISTIDVLRDPRGADESAPIDTEGLHPYGYDRYLLELWVRDHYPQALIIRLPGLFGANIKKNFIYDYINRIPFMLKAAKLRELSAKEPRLPDFYQDRGDGFYQVKPLAPREKQALKAMLPALHFSALNFTDSRSVYQFYPLSRLWADLNTALEAGIRLLHPATEPVSAAEVYRYLSGEVFVNELPGTPADYDYRTCHAQVFGGSGGYLMEKSQVLSAIRDFVASQA